MMSAIGLGTVLANIFGFLIIENMSVGFSVLCSYFDDNKTEVGFMYQKTLGKFRIIQELIFLSVSSSLLFYILVISCSSYLDSMIIS